MHCAIQYCTVPRLHRCRSAKINPPTQVVRTVAATRVGYECSNRGVCNRATGVPACRVYYCRKIVRCFVIWLKDGGSGGSESSRRRRCCGCQKLAMPARRHHFACSPSARVCRRVRVLCGVLQQRRHGPQGRAHGLRLSLRPVQGREDLGVAVDYFFRDKITVYFYIYFSH